MEYSVELRSVVKYRGRTPAVDRVSFNVRRGEFFSLLGPSGSGKTSTLRLLAGFDEPDAGEIVIDRLAMAGVPPNRRPVNLVFQQYALFPHLTVFDNVAFGLQMRGVGRAEIASRVGEALDMMQLSGKADRRPAQLSGGEQQRVALARALVNRPSVVLLDEPLGALDQQLRQDMQVELKAIQARVGLTFIYVTHHQEEALTMSHRVAVMDRGRILQIGSPQDVYERPASTFVARFIGLSNMLRGRVTEAGETRCTVSAADLPALSVHHAVPDVKPGVDVAVVVRPERVRVSASPHPGGEHNVLSGHIDQVQYSGSEMHYWVRLGAHVIWRARVSNTADEKPFAVGQAVFLRFSAADAMTLVE